MEETQVLIESILMIEWAMFSTVNASASEHGTNVPKASCQNYPEEFCLQRTAIFLTWSTRTLKSYLDDLKKAKNAGQNMMTIKYARMDNLIPCRNESPLIEKMANDKVVWQNAFMEKYPGIMSQGRAIKGGKAGIDWASFETYAKAEMETYSEQTLQYLNDDIERYKVAGENMSEAVYKNLAKAKGYDSLEAAETAYHK